MTLRRGLSLENSDKRAEFDPFGFQRSTRVAERNSPGSKSLSGLSQRVFLKRIQVVSKMLLFHDTATSWQSTLQHFQQNQTQHIAEGVLAGRIVSFLKNRTSFQQRLRSPERVLYLKQVLVSLRRHGTGVAAATRWEFGTRRLRLLSKFGNASACGVRLNDQVQPDTNF